MNTIRIGVITIWAAVAVTGYLSLRDAATGEAPPAQATRAQSAQIARAQSTNRAASHQAIDRAEHALDVPALSTATEPAHDPDTSDVTQPAQTQNQVFDALNADIGPEGEYVDPQALAAALGSDPELGRLLNP